jgi:hypothetical protein
MPLIDTSCFELASQRSDGHDLNIEGHVPPLPVAAYNQDTTLGRIRSRCIGSRRTRCRTFRRASRSDFSCPSTLRKNCFRPLRLSQTGRAQSTKGRPAGCSKRPSSHPPNPGAPRRAFPRARPQRAKKANRTRGTRCSSSCHGSKSLGLFS